MSAVDMLTLPLEFYIESGFIVLEAWKHLAEIQNTTFQAIKG